MTRPTPVVAPRAHRAPYRSAMARLAGLAVAAAVLIATGAHVPHAHAQGSGSTVGAVGRIQPVGGVLSLGMPAGSVVERLLVKEGDAVRRGAVLAILADRAARESELSLANERLKLLQETSAGRIKVAELERDNARNALQAAQTELKALEGLDTQTVAPRERRVRQQQLGQAEIGLKLAEARLADLQRSLEPERRQARAQVEAAHVALSRSQIVAPVAGVVVDILQRPGTAGSGAVLTMADTSVMQVVADVFEGDLARVAPGAKVRVNNAALGSGVTGVVHRVGRTVDTGSRLAKVVVQLDKPAPADRYLGMQVEVSIDAAAPAR